MINFLVKLIKILLTLKGNNEYNVTTTKQVYNARYAYRILIRGPRTELQQSMVLLDYKYYIH